MLCPSIPYNGYKDVDPLWFLSKKLFTSGLNNCCWPSSDMFLYNFKKHSSNGFSFFYRISNDLKVLKLNTNNKVSTTFNHKWDVY